MCPAQTRPGLFSHKQTRPSLRPAVPEPPPASLLPAERLRGGERRPHPVGIGVNSVGRGLWDHRVQPTSEPHHAKYSTALSATSRLPQNTSRLGDSPTPGQRIPSSPWKRPRSPQRAAPWLPESPGRRGRRWPLAGALSPGRRGRGGRAAPAPPWAPPSPLPAPPPACGGAAPPRGPARARGHTRARAARPAGQLAVPRGGHCASGPRATPGPSGRRLGRGGGGAYGGSAPAPRGGACPAARVWPARVGGPEAPRCRWGWGPAVPWGRRIPRGLSSWPLCPVQWDPCGAGAAGHGSGLS